MGGAWAGELFNPIFLAKQTAPALSAMLPVHQQESTSMSVYKVIEIVGTSPESWDKAAAAAVERAGETLRDLRIAEVTAQDVVIEGGKISEYRTKLKVSFKFEDG